MKEKIIKKASDLFLNLGFKSVTMDDIAQEMGISKKTIYAYFKTKTLLVKAVTELLFDDITCGIDTIREKDKNPIEEMFAIKVFVLEHLKNEKVSPQYQLQKYYPEIHKSLSQKHFAKMHDCTLTNLKKGVEMGLFRAEIDIQFISRMYFVGMNGIKDEILFPINQFPKVRLFEDYLDYHLRGIVTAEGLEILKKNNNNHTN